jgi:polyvinyl alcohol dehydrogenase (cytochrome)
MSRIYREDVMKHLFLVLVAFLVLAGSVGAADEPPAPSPGEVLYGENCAQCHDQAVYKAPSRTFLAMMGPVNVLRAMNDGLMQEQAATLDEQARIAVAEYLTGQRLADLADAPSAPKCDEHHAFDPRQPPTSLGFGVDRHNTRFHPALKGGLTVEDVSSLELKWAFAYPNAIKARSQPASGGGAIYFGGPDGTVRALDASTGCLRWAFKASAEVRHAPVLSPWESGDQQVQPVLYFGDILARVYAVKARTGELLWSAKVDDHPDATLTGSPVLVGARLFLPVSSLEVVAAMSPAYTCCTFRGSVVALDSVTGAQIWKSHTIDDEPAQVGVTSVGTPILAPSGAPVWTSPTIDEKRGRLYIGTGENYSSPADGNSDAIMAFDLETGKKLWVSQQTGGDAWNVGCLMLEEKDRANCPEQDGPDYDFGSSPMLVTLPNGRDVLIGGQKSGAVMAIDPDSGETLWKIQVGRGGIQGGVHFGMAAEGTRVYIPINDMYYEVDAMRYGDDSIRKPGLYAFDADSGERLWSAPTEDVCRGLLDCDPGISQAITAIPGAVIAGHMDGRLRIYSAQTGETIWEMNTLRDFETVSGATARGGSFSGSGALVSNGMLFVNSGYGIYNHMPGNVLLAFGPAGD